MPKTYNSLVTPLYPALNRGLVSKFGLARIDIERIQLSAEVFTNAMPRVLGSAMLRAGLGYKLEPYLNKKAKYLEFIFSFYDTAMLEFTDNIFRPIVDEAAITRPSVTTAISDDEFTLGTGWTDASDAGATRTYVSNHLRLNGNGSAKAKATQLVTVVESGTEHGLEIEVTDGTVDLSIGLLVDDEDFLSKVSLGRGIYSFSFTPNANFTVTLSSFNEFGASVNYCRIGSSGDLILATGYSEANLQYLRFDQSADVVFIACNGLTRQKILRYSDRSWGFAEYLPADGAFDVINTTSVTIATSAIKGEVTLTSSIDLFTSEQVDTLVKIDSTGQRVEEDLLALNDVSDSVRVSGLGDERIITRTLSGTWVGDVTWQKKIGDTDGAVWSDVEVKTINFTDSYDDGLDNQIIHYRFKFTAYTSGTVEVELWNGSGSKSGIARIVSYTNATTVTAYVLKDFGNTDGSDKWRFSITPTKGKSYSVAFLDNRLYWSGEDYIFGSIPDDYESFDEDVEGDSGVINRRIGGRSVANINWMVALNDLFLGGDLSEFNARSSDFGEVITPDTINIRSNTTQGSSNGVDAAKVDSAVFFVQSSGRDLYRLTKGDRNVTTNHMGYVIEGLITSDIVQVAVQRKPDTRIHCRLENGEVYVLVFEEAEEVQAWLKIETDGLVEDIVVLPAQAENAVYYLVNRDGTRSLERFALESECDATQDLAKCSDSHIAYTGVAITSLTGLDHLDGKEVVIWADGDDRGTATVASGSVALGDSYTNVCVGLYYKAQIKFGKLSQGVQGSPLNIGKKVSHIGLTMINAHKKGVKYGEDFTRLDDLPDIEEHDTVTGHHSYYDEQLIPFDGTYDTDARVCLQMESPKPCTLASLTIRMKANEK